MLCSCSKKEKNSLFESRQKLGAVSNKLSEASGLVASITNPGCLWTHNDGRNSSEVFLIDEHAKLVMRCKLKGIVNRDWEDITIGSGPEKGVNYLYVADIGDNEAVYSYKILYRIREPEFTAEKIEIEKIDKLIIELPDQPRDSEAIMVDPLTNYFYIISKREDSVRLYEIKPSGKIDTLQVEIAGKLPFTNVVAANISLDGSEVLVKTYRDIYYWKREVNESIPSLLQRKPVRLNYNSETQGEAMAWKYDGSGFYTLSESPLKIGGDLFFYKRK